MRNFACRDTASSVAAKGGAFSFYRLTDERLVTGTTANRTLSMDKLSILVRHFSFSNANRTLMFAVGIALGLGLAAEPAFAAEQPVAETAATAPCGLPPSARPLKLTGYKTSCLSRDSLPELQSIYEQWESALARHVSEAAFGNNATILSAPEQTQWKNLKKLFPSLPPERKLQYINGFFNNRPSHKDNDLYGEEEYWATPEEFLEKGGDCEDYALAKYFALRHLDWPEENMWILLVIHKESQERHAVLAVRDRHRTFMLDNLSRPAQLIMPEKLFLPNYTPLYAVNTTGVWSFTKAAY